MGLGPWLVLCAGYAAAWLQTRSLLPTAALITSAYVWEYLEEVITPYALVPFGFLAASAFLIKGYEDW